MRGFGNDQYIAKMAQTAIEEARMVLPGIQALFGFQLIAVFNEPFRQLAESEQVLHFIALMLVAISIALIMTPAAYHRLAEQGSVSAFFVRLASLFVAGAMVPLMIAISLEVFCWARSSCVTRRQASPRPLRSSSPSPYCGSYFRSPCGTGRTVAAGLKGALPP